MKRRVILALSFSLLLLISLAVVAVSAQALTEEGRVLENFDTNDDGILNIGDVTALLTRLSTGCGHQATILEGSANTCTNDGKTEGSYCPQCNVILKEQQVIPAAHSYDERGICTVCSARKPTQGSAVLPIEKNGPEFTVSADGSYCILSGIGNCTDNVLTIPESYMDLPVKEVGRSALEYATHLTGLILPEGLEIIRSDAFYGCLSLQYIVIPQSVTAIGKDALRGCLSLSHIFYSGNTARGIWDPDWRAGCTAPVYFASTWRFQNGIPSLSLSDLPEGASAGLAFTLSEDGTYYILSGLGDCTDSEIVVPAYYENGIPVKEICRGIFKKDIVGVTLPNSIASISKGLFDSCTDLQYVVIPDSVTAIEEKAFANCISLTDITLPKSLTAIGERAFYNCITLPRLSIPTSVTKIDAFAFANCDALKIISLPSGVKNLGNSVFYHCDGLLRASINASITTLPASSFYGCAALTTVSLPESITVLDEACLRDCINLSSITLPGALTTISDYAFYNTGLKVLSLPQSMTAIGICAFSCCSELTAVTLPDSVTILGGSAFYNCRNLKTIALSKSLNTLESNLFYNCKSLTALSLPQGLTSIGDSAFYGCTALNTLTLPATVKTIEDSAFRSAGLESMTLPESVSLMGDYVFYNCDGLTSLTLSPNAPALGAFTFYDCDNLTAVALPEGIITIGNAAFYGCEQLATLTLPHSVTSIGSEAFSSCTKLTVFGISANVQTIGANAFRYCTALKEIHCEASLLPNTWHALWNNGCSAVVYKSSHIHIPVSIPGIAASCTQTGRSAGSYCGECGKVLTAPKTAPPTAHRFVNGACAVCGRSEQLSITPKQKNFEHFGEINDPHNILDGDNTSVCGSGYNASLEQSITIDFGENIHLYTLTISCKDEGTPAQGGPWGTYDLYAVKNGITTKIATDVEAYPTGSTVTLTQTVALDALKIVITSWNGSCWACVADVYIPDVIEF